MAQMILIAEDDADIRNLLTLYLQSEGYEVEAYDNGADALAGARAHLPDLAILDVMMPQMDGYELTRVLREMSDIPILILSARDQVNDKVLGLNFGADDYIAKPFNPLEIVARVRAQLRRASRMSTSVLTVGDLSLDSMSCTLTRAGKSIPLTPTEYRILSVLMRTPGRIFTKVQLYEAVNGAYFESDDNTMMVHISKLRNKIEEDPKKPTHIITIKGLGYKFEKK